MVRKLLIWIIVLAVLGTGGYATYYYGYLLPEKERIAQEERERLLQAEKARVKAQEELEQPLDVKVRRSLAHPDAVMLGSFNNLRASETKANMSLADINSLRIDALANIDAVLEAVSTSRGLTRQTYFAFYPWAAGASLTPVIVLLGDYDTEAIEHYLQEQMHTESVDLDGMSLTMLYTIDETTCERHKPMALYVAEDHIVIGDQHLVPRITRRLAKKRIKDYVSPKKWQGFSADKTLTWWLRNPTSSIRRYFPAPYNSYVKDSDLGFRTFTDVFASYDMGEDLERNVIELELHGQNVNYVLAVHKAWERTIDEHREPLTLQIRSLDQAVNKIKLETMEKILSLGLSMDSAWFKQWPDISARITRYISEKLDSGRLKTSHKQLDTKLSTDRLAPDPPQFKRSVQVLDLRAYNSQYFPDMPVDHTSGPFGVSVDSIKDTGTGLSFTLSVYGTNIPNLGSGMGKATLKLSKVTGIANNPVQNQSSCGPKRFVAEVDLQRHKVSGVHHANLTVHLEQDVRASDVTAVEGSILINLPVKTSAHPIFLPSLLPYTETVRDLKITVFSLTNGVVEYSVEGDVDRILAFRALNLRRGVLEKVESMRSEVGDDLFPQAIRYTDRYEGRIHSLELVYADVIRQVDYPFALSSLSVSPIQEHFLARELEIMRVSPENFHEKVNAFKEANKLPLVGPFLMELSDLKSRKSLTGEIRIIAPATIPGLSGNLTVNLDLQLLELLDGSEIDLRNTQAIEDLVTLTEEPGILSGRLLFAPMEQQSGLLETYFRFQSDILVDPKRVMSIKGQVEVYLAQTAKKVSIPVTGIGGIVGGEAFKVRLVNISRDGYELHILEGEQRLVRVVPRDKSDRPLIPFFHDVIRNQDGSLRLKFEAGDVAVLDLYIADEMHTVSYPVQLDNN